MLHKTRGIVLHQLKYNDNSVIVHIYTEKFGRQSYIVSGGRSKTTKTRINLLQPLVVLDMEVYVRPTRQLQRIGEFRSTSPFRTIPYNVVKNSIALFMTEILYRTLREEEANFDMFHFLINSIHFLDAEITAAKDQLANFHLFFLLHLSRYLGFYPHNNTDATNRIFDLTKGKFVENEPVHRHFLDSNDSLKLALMLQVPYERIRDSQFRLSKIERSKMLEQLIEYYKLHIEGLGEIKSINVLREVFE